MQPPSPSFRAWFNHFAWINVILLCLQYAFVLSKSESFVSSLPLPSIAQFEIVLTLVIQLLLYTAFTIWQTMLMWGIRSSAFTPQTYRYLFYGIVLCSLGALLAANAYFFPLSQFSRSLFPEVPHSFVGILLLLCSLPLIVLSTKTLYLAVRTHRLFASSAIIMGIMVLLLPKLHTAPKPQATLSQPNVILIGIDSLHPSRIQQRLTPTLAMFLQQSIWFRETITPLARTYPAWSTILTGLHPLHHQAHYNLMPPETTLSRHSIAWTLQEKGYQTFFATDDRRFNSIDKEFGFQTIVGPKRGINDVLIGTFNDFPLSNLLINLPLGRFLFPYNHMNRASYFSYYPSTFNRAIAHALDDLDRHKPLFFVVHFTLPHWPYAFATSDAHDVENEYQVEHREPLYEAALQAVDQQVAFLLAALKKQNLLNNSLIVLLSDHGETLYTPNSRSTTRSTYQGFGESALETYFLHQTSTVLNKSAGHGSDLLSPAQYHCVLAFQNHASHAPMHSSDIVTSRVSLMDIAPTLFDFLNLKNASTMDGLSLLPNLKHPRQPLPSRVFMMESGMLPNQLLSQEQARRLGQVLFTVEPSSGFFYLRQDKLAWLDSLKLYAALQDDWLLALYPTSKGYLPVLQRLSTGAWIDDLNTSFAHASPAYSLLHQLTQFYHHSWSLASSSTLAAQSEPIQ